MSELTGYVNATAMCFDDGFHNSQSHSGTLNAIALALSTVKFVKNERALKVIDTASTIGNVRYQAVAPHFRADEDRRVRLRVLHCVLDEMAEDFRHPRRVHEGRRKLLWKAHLHWISGKYLPRFFKSNINYISN